MDYDWMIDKCNEHCADLSQRESINAFLTLIELLAKEVRRMSDDLAEQEH